MFVLKIDIRAGIMEMYSFDKMGNFLNEIFGKILNTLQLKAQEINRFPKHQYLLAEEIDFKMSLLKQWSHIEIVEPYSFGRARIVQIWVPFWLARLFIMFTLKIILQKIKPFIGPMIFMQYWLS